jgi:hypothetical protein
MQRIVSDEQRGPQLVSAPSGWVSMVGNRSNHGAAAGAAITVSIGGWSARLAA